jgi:type II secretion system protein G
MKNSKFIIHNLLRFQTSDLRKTLKTGDGGLKTGFTLVELMIVVAILGILAAIVLPEFQGHIQQANEAQAKANLKILRDAIERYAADHNGIPPGYPNADLSQAPNGFYFNIQLAKNKDYLSKMPKNPFNGFFSIGVLTDGANISNSVAGVFGWLYKPATREIWLDTPGTDSEGKYYYEY